MKSASMKAVRCKMHKTYFFEDLGLGMEASYTRIVTGADISAFAEISGDKNPLHLDSDFAARTMFRERVAHGMLSAGYISAVFGMEMPGPGAIYISQTLNFKGPVRIGDEVIAKVKVIQLFPEKRRALFDCVCLVGEQQVVTGEAMLLVPARPIDPESDEAGVFNARLARVRPALRACDRPV